MSQICAIKVRGPFYDASSSPRGSGPLQERPFNTPQVAQSRGVHLHSWCCIILFVVCSSYLEETLAESDPKCRWVISYWLPYRPPYGGLPASCRDFRSSITPGQISPFQIIRAEKMIIPKFNT